MIVVEGPDNSGKSTLVKQLVEHGMTLLERKRFKPGQEETIGVSYIDCICVSLDVSRNAVVDRLLASEIVYGDLFRGGHRITNQEYRAIIRLLLSHKAKVVFCDPGDAAILATWDKREQLYDRDPLKIARAYREQIMDIFYPIEVITYDWTRPEAFTHLLERITV